MAHIVTPKYPIQREDWLSQPADIVTDPDELLHLLNIDADENWLAGRDARRFSSRVLRAFIARMEKGNPDDPLFCVRYLPPGEEFVAAPASQPTLEEQHSAGSRSAA